MFATPPVLTTEVFARVPDVLRVRGRQSPWASVYRRGKLTDCFLEGPSFDRGGNLYVVDLAWGRVLKVSPEGEFDVFVEYDGQPNGLKIHRDGSLFVADRQQGVLQIDPVSRRITCVVEGFEGKRFQGINDLVFADNGDLYFTDQGMSGLQSPTGRVFRRRRDGLLDLLLDRIPSPNGLVLDREQTTLFVNVTRDNAVWRVPLAANGEVDRAGVFIRLNGGVGPDGLAIDSDGGLVIAHLGLGVVWWFSAMGEPLARIQSCAGSSVTNVAYGGPNQQNLFITESETGQILKAKMPVPGRPMFSHR
jgi:gluconolactonase